MGRGYGILVVGFPVGGGFAVKARPIPRGNTELRAALCDVRCRTVAIDQGAKARCCAAPVKGARRHHSDYQNGRYRHRFRDIGDLANPQWFATTGGYRLARGHPMILHCARLQFNLVAHGLPTVHPVLPRFERSPLSCGGPARGFPAAECLHFI